MNRTCLVAAILAATNLAHAQLRDTGRDQWAATDALGRAIAIHPQARPAREKKFVGMFYFLWQTADETTGPWDVSRILANDPDALAKTTSPPWGPLARSHFWAEPLFGYYHI